jgi:hypothetical protein
MKTKGKNSDQSTHRYNENRLAIVPPEQNTLTMKSMLDEDIPKEVEPTSYLLSFKKMGRTR